MSKTARWGAKYRPIVAGLLIAAALVMVFLAWQSVSTDQYKLYSRNYDYYMEEAQKCHEMEDSSLGAHYGYLAREWEESAQMAGSYLTQHRAGAASLAVVSIVGFAFAVRLLTGRKKETDESEKSEKA